MSKLITPKSFYTRQGLAKLFTHSIHTSLGFKGEVWYTTQYTGVHLATGRPVRECWARGKGDSTRLFVTFDGSYYID